jgi:CHAT domain-containing protein/Tfp pilus assembly protein PilF
MIRWITFTVWLCWSGLPAYSQLIVPLDTVSASHSFQRAEQHKAAGSCVDALPHYLQAAEGYQQFALQFGEQTGQASVQQMVWERHFTAQAMAGWCMINGGSVDSAMKHLQAAITVYEQQLKTPGLALASLNSSLAVAYYRLGNSPQALVHFNRTLDLLQSRLGNNHPKVASTYNNLGNVLKSMGNFQKAIAYYEQGLHIQQQLLGPKHPQLAGSMNNIGTMLQEQGEYNKALTWLQQALAMRLSLYGELHQEVADSYYSIGTICEQLANYDSAFAYYERALRIEIQVLDGQQSTSLAATYSSIANIYRAKGFYTHAQEYYQKAIAIEVHVLGEQHPLVASSYVGLGTVYYLQGEYARAIHYHQQALDIYHQANQTNHANLAICYNNLGNDYFALKSYIKARENYEQALSIAQAHYAGTHPSIAAYMTSIGLTHRAIGHYALALSSYRQALAIQEQVLGAIHPDIASTLNNIGTVLDNQQDYRNAISYYQRALAIWKPLFGPKHPSVAMSYNNISMAYGSMGQLTQALVYVDSSLNAYCTDQVSVKADLAQLKRTITSPDILKHALLSKALLHQREPDGVGITQAQAAIGFADRLIDSLRKAYTYEGDKLQLSENANQIYGLAVELAYASSDIDQAFYYAEKNKAVILAQTLNEAQALKLGSIPDSLVQKERELKLSLAYLNKAIVDMQQKCPACDSLQLKQLKQARFNDQQAEAKLIRHLEQAYPDYYTLKYQYQTTTISALQQGLLMENPQTAVLNYFLTDSALFSFCITKDTAVFYRQSLDTTAFRSTNRLVLAIHKLNHALKDARLVFDPIDRLHDPASQLYQYLIMPFHSMLSGKDLLVIPDAALLTIPFEVLMPPGTSETKSNPVEASNSEPQSPKELLSVWKQLPYLVRSHSISYAYSATLLYQSWKMAQEKRGKVTSGSPHRGFIGFAPVFDEYDSFLAKVEAEKWAMSAKRFNVPPHLKAILSDHTYYPPLEGTEREIEAIQKLFTRYHLPAQSYLREQANELHFNTLDLAHYQYIHFATHGVVDEEIPSHSYIVLGAFPDSTSDNLLTSSEMYGLELDAELVVLSACQTGKGKLRAGEGIIGLTRGLLYAGARNLLVSQWNVNDASTAELMTKFYAKILAGQSNRQALREAKLELLSSKFACPYFWAAFVLVGR